MKKSLGKIERKIVSALRLYNPEKILLFGSRVFGKSKKTGISIY